MRPLKTIIGNGKSIHIQYSLNTGGKAGKGNNRTASLQCIERVNGGEFLRKNFRYVVGNELSLNKAKSKAIAWAEKYCEIVKEKEVSFRETLVALTIEVSNDHNRYAFLYHRLEAGYSGVISELINWATEFEKMFEGTDWDVTDWYDAIDAYVEESLEELGYDKEETYEV
jgi:hypothetical protein